MPRRLRLVTWDEAYDEQGHISCVWREAAGRRWGGASLVLSVGGRILRLPHRDIALPRDSRWSGTAEDAAYD